MKWQRVGKRCLIHCGALKPIISWIEETKDPNNKKTDHQGVVDLVLFDGACNVQNARKLVSITYLCITVVHGAKRVVLLFSKDIFTKMPVFQCLSQFTKWYRKIFGSTCHGPHATLKEHSIMHNNHIYIGFIKISERCMARELIGLRRLLRLRDILRATIASKEFKDIWKKTFWIEVLFLKTMSSGSIYLHCDILSMHQCIPFDWPTRKFLQLTSFIIMFCQTDKFLAKYVKIAEVDSGHILELDKTVENMRFMTNRDNQYMNESDNEEDGKDDVEDIDPGDKLVNYFNNGNNYDDDDDDDDANDDDDNDRVLGNNDNVHSNANIGGRQFVVSCLSGRDYCG